jgi:hypothetical protein
VEIGTELKQELGVVLHPRTIEKVLKELQPKKLLRSLRQYLGAEVGLEILDVRATMLSLPLIRSIDSWAAGRGTPTWTPYPSPTALRADHQRGVSRA